MRHELNHPTIDLINKFRTSQLPIDPQFLTRWSPRSYDGSALRHDDLMILFEAARWAPSAYNVQPWRFLYSLRNDEYWQLFLDLLDPFNAGWAKNSGALVYLLSDTLVPDTNPSKPFHSHSFDAGAAWIQLALQAQQLGYMAHAMGGIFPTEIRKVLHVPERYKIEIGIAIGKPGDPKNLPKQLQDRERPSTRLPLTKLIHYGKFNSPKILSGHPRENTL